MITGCTRRRCSWVSVSILCGAGKKGFPYVNSFDSASRTFGQPHMLLAGKEESINKKRYRNDHHYAPVIWADTRGHLHTLFGYHRTPGLHMVSG